VFINWLKNIRRNAVEKLEDKAYEIKDKYIKSVLGKEHRLVSHSVIPFVIGGRLDLYYYPDYCNGTAIATKELTNYKFKKPKNHTYDAYELVMVTRYKLDLDSTGHKNPPENTFAYDHKYISRILSTVAVYSKHAKLNPYETMEFPEDFDEIVGGKCLILDALSEPFCNQETKNRKLGLMLLMEIHRDEMEYAIQHRGENLINKLKDKGVYPFTGIHRPSVL